MKILVGSASQRKINVVKKIFLHYFNSEIEIIGCDIKSNVPDTPYGEQTFEGAKNRALGCQKSDKADYYVGLESGLVERYGQLFEEAWSYVITKDQKVYIGYSSGLKVPEYIQKRMKDLNKEHSDVMSIIEKELDKVPNDTWGTYSGGVILRDISLEESLRNAIIQLLPHNKSLYHL
ncbi:DUF84 family protein [Candidatus Daviesbacteria bacterium]|nr:DUF84 family protein [Candidatus Daviesbacteria bacterium]